jgi:uncharacterized protein (DUF433 family)
MNSLNAVTVHPEIQDGAPVFSGTRIRIETFFDYHRIGVSINEFLSDFPSITRDQVMEVSHLVKQSYSLEQIKNLAVGPDRRHNNYQQNSRPMGIPAQQRG